MIDLEVRRKRIGGSEVGAIFGCHPYLDGFTLWARKKTRDIPDAPSDRMIAGKFFEEAILKLYKYKTKRDVEYFDQTMVSKERPWMAYSPDGLVRGEKRGVDAKLVAWDQRRNWDNDVPPEYIQLQAYYYMAAMDYPVWDIAAMVGDELRIIEIERLDARAETAMLTRVWEWHQRYIEGDERPDITGTKAAGDWLQRQFPHHKRPDLREATLEEIALLTEYAEVRYEFGGLKERKVAIENMLKLAIAEKEGLVWPEGKFTWRRIKDSKEIQWENMARGLLNEFVKDPAKRAEIEAFYTRVKEGYRKIRFEHDDLNGGEEAA